MTTPLDPVSTTTLQPAPVSIKRRSPRGVAVILAVSAKTKPADTPAAAAVFRNVLRVEDDMALLY
jgi:hypothetical protein